jgi:hypothetical protein
MARLPGWMTVVDERRSPDGEHWVLTVRLAPFFWARPTFWLAVLRRWGRR